MQIDRRAFVAMGAVAGFAALSPWRALAQSGADPALSPITGDVEPIAPAEHLARVVRAQQLMREAGIGALMIEPGASMTYFTGVQWWRSERLTAAIVPVEGEPCIVTPHFEEPSVRESLKVPAEVRIWHEHVNPLDIVAGFLADRGVAGPVGVEETVRFFATDGLRRAMPAVEIVPGAPVVRGCRMIKSAHEIALMQKASDVTIAAYRHIHPRIEAGMTPADIEAMYVSACLALGAQRAGGLILLGEASAYPHGSGQPQHVREGEVVLLDSGCNVHGYQSDISRSFVYGDPNADQRRVWEQMRRGQDIAMEAAQVGRPAGSVDDAVRAYYEGLGYGPDYALPGLSHRTGHGIGMEGHEPINLVRGEETPLAPGMCFSNEPGIYLPGSFGIRLEDCFHMTEAGPQWFSVPPPSIDEPFG
ncbi:M24 family metallopeptidase [Parasphingopyxis marina]|uniref:Aminopeptidase P family protein n=1 Tax=Parasphingopyxis marina TaxID=2761622 RepID=A0A842HVW6_9SPHN|nr:Xaa-Pro peptidase family protein [Parasphingopyxis marina]MBC2776090.1 aminopeptidase P family protein [Parasphingopyxis marina]